MLLGGEPVAFVTPREALEHKVAAIAQEPNVVPQLSVAENVLLGSEPVRGGFIRSRRLKRRYTELARSAGFDLRGDTNAERLGTAEQQKVEILRALSRDAQLIVMDEPTAALDASETAQLHEIVRGLVASGKTIILISHFLKEVLELADTVTVLRDGRLVKTAPTASETEASLIEAMLGQPLTATFPPKVPPAADAPVALDGARPPWAWRRRRELRAARGRDPRPRRARRSRAHRAGADDLRCRADRVRRRRSLHGPAPWAEPAAKPRRGRRHDPRVAQGRGADLRPLVGRERRRCRGCRHLARSASSAGARSGRLRNKVLERCGVRGASFGAPVNTLSGGNQQKVLLARMLLCEPGVVIADEPTRGVDIGAKRAIYEFLAELASEGIGILLISSEVEELIGLAHRVLVMRRGRIVDELEGGEISESRILAAAFADQAAEAAA